MSEINALWSYLWANKEWLFDGAGLAAVSAVFGGVILLIRKRRSSTPTKANRLTGAGKSEHPHLPRGYDKAPRLEFADGVVAEVALSIEAEIERFFDFAARFKTWQEFFTRLTPDVHIRLTQMMERHTYAEAKAMREDFERALMEEFSPHVAQYGVKLKRIGIGSFVRRGPDRRIG
ncbi:hypothetical protein [Caulobacter sp. UC70_42]|uniref:hypothetical protein n=1 Tax=Caulobacter sp. UC70_42 TaxID=3374551 RepID=UPI003756EBC8